MSKQGGVFRTVLLLSIVVILYYIGIEFQRNQDEALRSTINSREFQPARESMVYQKQEDPVIQIRPLVQPKQEDTITQKESLKTSSNASARNHFGDLSKICDEESMKRQGSFDPTGVSRLFAVDTEHPIFYCPIQKVGSSFWLRTLTVMGSKNKYATPYEITLAQKSLKTFASLKKLMTPAEQKQYIKDAFAFTFVRDPYSRLFSGYIDKVYYPNVVYWPSFTSAIVKAIRKNPSPASLTFGHDVTFAEFIEYILQQFEAGEKLDIHFAPMHQLCNPCNVKYSFVGRFENFQEDAEYLLQYFRSRFPDFTLNFADFEEESIYDETIRHVRMLFAAIDINKGKLKYPIYNFLQRGWSNAQLRGHLTKNAPLPFAPKTAANMTVESFMEAFDKASAKEADKTLIKAQRIEAMIQAYSTLSASTLERLYKFVSQDCQWFGYEGRPSNIYNKQETKIPEHDYLIGL